MLPSSAHSSLLLPVAHDSLNSINFLCFSLFIWTSLAVGTRRNVRRFQIGSINTFLIKSAALVWCIFIDVLYYRTPFKVTIMGRGEALSVVFSLLISDFRMLVDSPLRMEYILHWQTDLYKKKMSIMSNKISHCKVILAENPCFVEIIFSLHKYK